MGEHGAVDGVTLALEDLVEVVARNHLWMAWNLILAAIPALLAPVVFGHRGPRTAGWWIGAGVVLLFLPNAPYVVTDLVHLRGDVLAADSDLAVVAGVLPVYAGFILAGFVAYAIALSEAGRYLDAAGLGRWRARAEVVVHLVCAVGVVLGRVARLNSWEPVTEPAGTFERVVLTLSWRWAPVAVVATFVVVWAGHALVRTVGRAVDAWLRAQAPGLRSAFDRGPGAGAA
jgi:uncharacterized membrane protein